MISMLMLFPETEDTDSLDSFAVDQLLPALREADGIESVTVSRGQLMSPAGRPPYSRIVMATAANMQPVIKFGTSPKTEDVRKAGERLGVMVLMYEVSQL